MIPSPIYPLTTLLPFILALFCPTAARPSNPNTLPNAIRSPTPNLSLYAPVLTDGTSSLPAPTGTLKYITLGRGTQNYTCASSTSAPLSDGATATLFNVAQLLPAVPATQGQAILNALPNALVGDTVAQIKQSGLPVIGEHHFTAGGVPFWDLFGADAQLYGASVGDVPAPAGANAGPEGYGAVDWKALTAVAGSVGLDEVYRVETAGGKAPASCSGFGATIQSQYAAMYWFYG